MKFNRTALSAQLSALLPDLLPALVVTLSVFVSTSAMAQYTWLDASGRKVFSDQPPPASIPSKRILQQPGKLTATPVTSSETDSKPAEGADAAAKAAAKPVAAEKITSKDKDLEAAKKKIDDEAAAKKKEEQEVRDKAKADNCVRAKQAKATLDSGMRLSQINAKGERGFMDEAARTVEAKRAEGIIAADCKVN